MVRDVMQVCKKGHIITEMYNRHPEDRKVFCDECGAQTITSCTNCKNNIPGFEYDSGFIDLTPRKPPVFCQNCGTSFPWNTAADTGVATDTEPPITATNSSPELLLEQIFSRFHLISEQLMKRHSNRDTLKISDEYDVQDLLHAILKIFFNDVRSEECVPSYAGGSSRQDFLLYDEQLVIEVKHVRQGHTDGKIGEELIIDESRYKAHPRCKKLFCFVYDPAHRLSNPRGIETDLKKNYDDFSMRVFIRPN